MKHFITSFLLSALAMLTVTSCIEPPLHLPEGPAEVETLLEVDIDIDVDLETEWYYGWDDRDKEIFGEWDFPLPSSFQIRRYFTGDEPFTPHTSVLADAFDGKVYRASYDWGFWDLLTWNDITTLDGVQSLRFDEETSLDYVTAYTGQTMIAARYQSPRFTRSFYQPEMLYAAYNQGLEIDKELTGFTYDEERDVWVKHLNLKLRPLTYIYLTQVIVHHNRGRITGVDGNGNLSGMAQSVNMNSGVAGSTPITVHYNVRFKTACDMNGESVDIAGGRLLTFGMCNVNGSRSEAAVDDGVHHYMDVNMIFNNGNDSTFVFDVTEQVRRKPRGGVITIELDADTLTIPGRKGGSGFDAVVKDFEDGGTHEFEM